MAFTLATHKFNNFFGLERNFINDSSHVDKILLAIKDLTESEECDKKDPQVLYDIFPRVLMKIYISALINCKLSIRFYYDISINYMRFIV